MPCMLFLCVFLVSSVMLIRYAIRSASTKKTNEALETMYEEASNKETATPAEASQDATEVFATEKPAQQPRLLDSYQYIGSEIQSGAKSLYKKNPDFIAWLRIPGVVSLPVMYRDNSYYLDHDYNGKHNTAGTLFIDANHPFREDTQYMVIHGHNMYDGSMFGLLSHYRSREYMEQHPYVYFNTLYRDETYKIAAVLIVSPEPGEPDYVAYTGKRKFFTEERFYEFVESLAQQAKYWAEDEELYPSDALLALSTCYEDDRIVLICKRILP